MTETQLFNAVGIETKPTDVVFITNQQVIPANISNKLLDVGYFWEKLAVETFIERFDKLGVIGTAVLDTTEVDVSQKQALFDCIGRLEKASIATILINDHIDFPFEKFEIVSILRSASIDELMARIETNVIYHRNLSRKFEQPSLAERKLADEVNEQLRMAGQVQRDFLPVKLPNCSAVHWKTVYQPADWVSGDIYDIVRLDEQHMGFYVADAVGHSMPAALLTMFLKQAITMRQTKGNDYQIFVPLEVIKKLNSRMLAQNLKASLFVTCCYCLLNIRTLQLTYCRAGHPYPILIRRGCKPVQLQGQGGLVGVFSETHFEQESVQLQQGDKLFIYTDGAEHIVGSSEKAGEFVFSEDFRSIMTLPVDEMMQAFDLIARNSRNAQPVIDDITVVALEIN